MQTYPDLRTLDTDVKLSPLKTSERANIGTFDPTDPSTLKGIGVGAAGGAAADALSAGGSGLLDAGLAIGDAVLDAIPVVGEIAMVATAIAGFFEGIFGGDSKPTPPPEAIVSKSGADVNSIVQQTPQTLQV